MKKYPSQDDIKKHFEYRGGDLYRKIATSNYIKKGQRAGTYDKHGYRVVSFHNSRFKVHRLIWIMFNGTINKSKQIDHINGVRDDNRIENLRLVTNQQNHFNESKAKGYHWHPRAKKYQAQIKVNGQKLYLGLYKKEAEARNAYLEAKHKYHKIEVT